MDGLRRLRGEARRSDIVTVDLMARNIYGKVDRILERLDASREREDERGEPGTPTCESTEHLSGAANFELFL